MSEWVGESRPVPEGLDDPTVHVDYTPTPMADALKGVPVAQRLDAVMRERLREMFGQVV